MFSGMVIHLYRENKMQSQSHFLLFSQNKTDFKNLKISFRLTISKSKSNIFTYTTISKALTSNLLHFAPSSKQNKTGLILFDRITFDF